MSTLVPLLSIAILNNLAALSGYFLKFYIIEQIFIVVNFFEWPNEKYLQLYHDFFYFWTKLLIVDCTSFVSSIHCIYRMPARVGILFHFVDDSDLRLI